MAEQAIGCSTCLRLIYMNEWEREENASASSTPKLHNAGHGAHRPGDQLSAGDGGGLTERAGPVWARFPDARQALFEHASPRRRQDSGATVANRSRQRCPAS